MSASRMAAIAFGINGVGTLVALGVVTQLSREYCVGLVAGVCVLLVGLYSLTNSPRRPWTATGARAGVATLVGVILADAGIAAVSFAVDRIADAADGGWSIWEIPATAGCLTSLLAGALLWPNLERSTKPKSARR